MFYYLLLLFLSLTCPIWGIKPPELSPVEVKETLQQLFETHACQKTLSTELMNRAIELFIENLDPTKTYFLKEEIIPWLQLSEEELVGHIKEIEEQNFSLFQNIHKVMLNALERRKLLEEQVGNSTFDNVSYDVFKDLKWCENPEELAERLILLHSLHKKIVQQFEEEAREKILQKIEKKRLNREEEIAHAHFILPCALKAFASSLDTHTTYFTPQEASQFLVQLQQRLFGAGVQLRDDLNGFTIVKVIEGGPSDTAGLKENDRIISINKEPVVGMDILDVVELIRGDEGTSVEISVLREEQCYETTLSFNVIRGKVVIKEARVQSSIIPFGDGIIAHLSLHSFYQDNEHSSSEDLYQEILKLKREHKIRGVILDLRSNAGGVLPQAVSVAGLFISKGIVVSIKDNNGNIEHLRNFENRMVWDGPLIVLINKASASASEIVAQSLQDYGRAIVVGDENSYGKGTFQTLTLDTSSAGKINPKGEFKVTRGKYYTVSGKSPQLHGVKADIVIPGVLSKMDVGEKKAKYPLENDSITPNFHDDLSDIPSNYREQINWLYRFNLQPCLKLYTQFLTVLKKNSALRIENDALYQQFLASLASIEELKTEEINIFFKSDPQLQESINVLKDLILLLK